MSDAPVDSRIAAAPVHGAAVSAEIAPVAQVVSVAQLAPVARSTAPGGVTVGGVANGRVVSASTSPVSAVVASEIAPVQLAPVMASASNAGAIVGAEISAQRVAPMTEKAAPPGKIAIGEIATSKVAPMRATAVGGVMGAEIAVLPIAAAPPSTGQSGSLLGLIETAEVSGSRLAPAPPPREANVALGDTIEHAEIGVARKTVGGLVTLQGKQTFAFNNAASQSVTLYLGARAYSLVKADSGVLQVRVAALSLPAGASIEIGLANVMICADDPTSIYTPFSGGTICSVTINASDTGFPRLYTASFTASSSPPPGAMCEAYLRATYAGTTGAGSITVGVALVVREY